MEIKIKYKRKTLNINLIFGVIWLIFGLLNLNYNGENRWMDFGYLVFGIVYLAVYFYQKHYKYLTIKNGVLKMNTLFGKHIHLKDIKQIKRFAGDYILETNKNKLTVNTKIIDPSSLSNLNTELEKLNIQWR